MQYSLLEYMQSSEFSPVQTITESDLRSLLLESATEQKTGATSIYEKLLLSPLLKWAEDLDNWGKMYLCGEL